jgi:hypothetical protein
MMHLGASRARMAAVIVLLAFSAITRAQSPEDPPQAGAPATAAPPVVQKNAPALLGKQSRVGMTQTDLRLGRLFLGLDYLDFGGQVYESSFTPSIATNLSAFFDFHRGLGTLLVRLRPESFASIVESRKEAKSSYAFQQQYKSAARQAIAQKLRIPVELVDTVVPPSAIAAAESAARDIASNIVDERIDIGAAWKTALDAVTYSLALNNKFTFSIGKDHPFQERDLLPEASSIMFGSVPNLAVSHESDHIVSAVRVFHDRESIESPFGVANAYVRAVLREGDHFFRLDPDSFDVSGNVKPATLHRRGLDWVRSLAFGAGGRRGDPFVFLRTDFEEGGASVRNLISWQDTGHGIRTQYSVLGRWRVLRRLALGTDYYLHTGTQESFFHLEPVADFTLRFRAWRGWLGDYQTHLVVERGYSRGPLVKALTSRSEIVKDWNLEIRMLRPER